eukprot:5303451-Pyramimonas_sp.AAC.1
MKHGDDKWTSRWTPNPHQARFSNAGLNELRSLAMVSLEEHSPIELRDVSRACTCFSATTAVGVDLWKPRLFLSAPVDALERLIGIRNTIEATLSFPPQCHACIVALLPKSARDERTAVKCPELNRVYCQARGFDVDDWSQKHTDF